MFNYNLTIMKKVSLLLLCVFAALSISAQETTSGTSVEAGRKTTFKKNGFWDNWFVGAGASGNVFFGPGDNNADFTSRITVNPTIMIGTWINPYFGIRAAGQYGSIHTFSHDARHMDKHTHLNAHLDVMFNFTNYVCKYNEKRFYNFIPTLGVGYERRAEDDNIFEGRGFHGVTLNASLMNTFRFSNRLSLYIELGGYLVEQKFDKGTQAKYAAKNGGFDANNVGRMNWNGIASATAGLMLKVGKVGFEEAVLMDQGLIDELNRKVNGLQAENDELRKRPVRCDNCPEVKPCPPVGETGEVVVPNVVFFRLNSANIDNNQEISIYNTAEYLRNNSGAKVKIVGYADKQTGTADYNMKLSERRAKNVAKTLIEKYNISSDRVKVEWKGSSEQPYKENAWNRVAIFFAE